MSLHEYKNGDTAEGFFLLSGAFAKQTANGKPFLSVVLEDKSGTMEGKVWDYAGPVSPADVGVAVKVRGTVGEYNGAPQMTIKQIRLAEETDDWHAEDLVPTAPIDVERSMEQVRAIVDSMTDTDYAQICRVMLKRHGDRFAEIPAAKSVHHGFLNGLLMHTLFMLKMADQMATLYAPVVDRSLLLAGTLLHDFSKIEEFVTSPLGLVTDYSVKGNLLGHLVMGAAEVASVASEIGTPEEKSVLLQHMILSHHGEPEFGAAVVPQCAESELLSYIDRIDSRMEIYRETMEEVPVGTFSRRIYALEHKIYHHG